MSEITFNGMGSLFSEQEPRLLTQFRKVLASGSFILSDEVAHFEHRWAALTNSAACAGVANGLDALEISLRALRLEPGSQVLVPSLSAMPTLLGVMRANLEPVLVDVDPQTGLMDMEMATAAVTPRTSAIVGVHLYGRMLEPVWATWAQDRHLMFIEDAAQAHAANSAGRFAGSMGDIAAWSFYPTKNLGALGDAGAVTSSSVELVERARVLRNYGQLGHYDHAEVGSNSRLDELQAAILDVLLDELMERTLRRARVADLYYAGIGTEHIELLAEPSRRHPNDLPHVYHLFVVKTASRDAFRRHLADKGVPTLVHYPRALGDQRATQSANVVVHSQREAQIFSSQCVSLPIHHDITDPQAEYIIDVVNSFEGPR